MSAESEAGLEARLRQRMDRLTKPRGALGVLEGLSVQVGLLLGTEAPVLRAPQMLVFAADHGIAEAGVSAYPPEVTAQMLVNYVAGGAAINVLARQHGLALTVVDAGVRGDPMGGPEGTRAAGGGVSLLRHRLGEGTRDFRYQPAMTSGQCHAALLAGRGIVRACLERGGNVLLLGEMGIGNTASAAVLLHRLLGWPLQACVGRGTGLDDAGLAHKLRVLTEASARCPAPLEPLDTLAEFGGFEIAMLVGAILEAATRPCVIVIDGFTVSVAALLAAQLQPGVPGRCVFSHCSAERAHRQLLDHFGATPLLDLGMRLGEGSGAAMAYPLLQSSACLLVEMASFESAGVSGRGA